MEGRAKSFKEAYKAKLLREYFEISKNYHERGQRQQLLPVRSLKGVTGAIHFFFYFKVSYLNTLLLTTIISFNKINMTISILCPH